MRGLVISRTRRKRLRHFANRSLNFENLYSSSSSSSENIHQTRQDISGSVTMNYAGGGVQSASFGLDFRPYKLLHAKRPFSRPLWPLPASLAVWGAVTPVYCSYKEPWYVGFCCNKKIIKWMNEWMNGWLIDWAGDRLGKSDTSEARPRLQVVVWAVHDHWSSPVSVSWCSWVLEDARISRHCTEPTSVSGNAIIFTARPHCSQCRALY